MSRKLKVKGSKLKVTRTAAGKVRMSLTFDHQLDLRIQLYCYFETTSTTIIKWPSDLKTVEAILRVALMSEVYAKTFERNSRAMYSITVSRAQACAIIIALAPSNLANNIELKAALLKAL